MAVDQPSDAFEYIAVDSESDSYSDLLGRSEWSNGFRRIRPIGELISFLLLSAALNQIN